MKTKLNSFINNLKNGRTQCFIPKRKGLRKIIKQHIFHHHAEIFLQVSGVTVFSFPHEEISLSAGQMLIVPPELPHGEKIEKVDDAFETVVITAASDYLQCHLAGESGLGIPTIFYYEKVSSHEDIRTGQLVDLLIEVGNPLDSYGRIVSQGLLLALLANVTRLFIDSPPRMEESNKVNEAKNIILSQYGHSSLTVSQLSSLLNCSADYLSWLFHNETGVTLNKFINQLRLERAADLLKNTDYTISEIAWICGFSNAAYFSRVFSAHYKSPPRDFRKM